MDSRSRHYPQLGTIETDGATGLAIRAAFLQEPAHLGRLHPPSMEDEELEMYRSLDFENEVVLVLTFTRGHPANFGVEYVGLLEDEHRPYIEVSSRDDDDGSEVSLRHLVQFPNQDFVDQPIIGERYEHVASHEPEGSLLHETQAPDLEAGIEQLDTHGFDRIVSILDTQSDEDAAIKFELSVERETFGKDGPAVLSAEVTNQLNSDHQLPIPFYQAKSTNQQGLFLVAAESEALPTDPSACVDGFEPPEEQLPWTEIESPTLKLAPRESYEFDIIVADDPFVPNCLKPEEYEFSARIPGGGVSRLAGSSVRGK